jgi:hypothetical protein
MKIQQKFAKKHSCEIIIQRSFHSLAGDCKGCRVAHGHGVGERHCGSRFKLKKSGCILLLPALDLNKQ